MKSEYERPRMVKSRQLRLNRRIDLDACPRGGCQVRVPERHRLHAILRCPLTARSRQLYRFIPRDSSRCASISIVGDQSRPLVYNNRAACSVFSGPLRPHARSSRVAFDNAPQDTRSRRTRRARRRMVDLDRDGVSSRRVPDHRRLVIRAIDLVDR